MSQDALLNDLKTQIAEGNVVVIAGTGVAIAACGDQKVDDYPVARWDGLLRHGVDHCLHVHGILSRPEAKALNAQIRLGTPDFLAAAAELITGRLRGKSPGTYRAWLKESVGKLQPTNPDILHALADLGGILATLNYDPLFELATERRAVTWRQPDKVEEILRDKAAGAVLHPHGHYDDPESVVLGLASYDKVKDDAHAKAVLQLFTLDRTLLFVGCGGTVKDPNFSRLIEWANQAHRDTTHRHFRLCRKSELKAVRAEQPDAPWLFPVVYGDDFADLVPFLRSLAPALGARTPRERAAPPAGLDLKAYRQAMRKRYGRLKLEDLDPTTHDVRALTLTGMFIPQSVRECAEFLPRVLELPKEVQQRLRQAGELHGEDLDPEVHEQYRRAYQDQSPRPVLDAVADPGLSRLVILGDPGSGKSTLLQYLVVQWAEGPGDGPLPLLIELREFARFLATQGSADFLDFLESASVRCPLGKAPLEAWLRAKPSLAFFDGLDEVFDPDQRREVTAAIHRFADSYPLARVVVTSRVFGFLHQVWRSERFRHLMLQELDEPQIQDFLARWHRAVYADPHDGDPKRERLARAISDSRAIRQLAGNPLLLTLMAILNRTQDLPRDRAELYEQCSRLLLHQWKLEEAADPELAKAALDYKDKRGLLLRVARTMLESPRGLAANLIEEDALECALAGGLRDVPNLRPDRAARALIEQLRSRNFMLCFLGGHAYAFVHRTFLEYFCADGLRLRFDHEKSLSPDDLKDHIFGPHWADDAWHEVLCLLAGMLHPQALAPILGFLLAQKDPEQTCQHIFLAARCVGEVRKRADLGPIAETVLERLKALIQFDLSYYYEDREGDAEKVRTIRTRAVALAAQVWRDAAATRAWLKSRAQSDKNEWVRQAAVQELARGWKADPETVAWLKARAQSDESGWVRQAAVEELARGWKADPETVAWLKARAQSDENYAVRRAAVEELARGWKEDPETVAILKSSAQSDEHGAVRQAAVQELARGWKEDPQTLAWLKARAQEDGSEWVRQVAVRELARGWKADPETVAWLKARAQSDEHWVVRRAAVEELARGWKEDPETVAWLKARAQSDEDWPVRQAAVQELARGWKEDPETVEILKDRAQSDEDGAVRGAAVRELARGWKEDPETVEILKDRAQSDENEYVRQAAVEELARGWKEDPETVEILKDRAQLDKNSEVRRAAVQELARGWKEDPQTLAILKARAQEDEDSAVRQAAVQELARGWTEDPQTLAILKARAQEDENEYVRRAAARELARGWKDDPDVARFLAGLKRGKHRRR